MHGERSTLRERGNAPVYRLLVTVQIFLCLTAGSLDGQIQDNSFLIEEAYNQEEGVVQHVSTFQRADGGDWAYTFTQEWPLGGPTHQLSYTVPVERTSGDGAGVGDIGLNYRYQLLGSPEASTVAVGRLTLLLPTGDETAGRGAGGVGLQAQIPVSLMLNNRLATHWNAGATLIPSADNGLSSKQTTTSFNLGVSAIWLFRPALNFLVEALWLSTEEVAGTGTLRQEPAFLNPGLRFAVDVGELQIVPGVAYTIGLNDDADADALFVYLSLEHPFKRQ